MKQEHEKIYRELWTKFKFNENLQDCLQLAMVKTLENKPTFNDDSHFRNYLLSAVKTGRIDVEQQREHLVSLSNLDKETDHESYQVSIPRDNYLYKWILTRKTSKGNYLFTCKQRKVLAKRYLSGKNNVEISKELKVSRQAIDKIVKAIDRKLLTLPIKDMIGSWYHGSGFVSRSDIWDVYPDIKTTKIGYLKRYRRTGNLKDRDLFLYDSMRCLQSHLDRIGDTAKPIYNDNPIPPGIPEQLTSNIPDPLYQLPCKPKPLVDSIDRPAHVIADRLSSKIPAHIYYNCDPMLNECMNW